MLLLDTTVLLVAGIFGSAGAIKVLRPTVTAEAMRRLAENLPDPLKRLHPSFGYSYSARALGFLEIAAALLMVGVGGPNLNGVGILATSALSVAFVPLVGLAVRAKTPCGCAASRKVATRLDLVRSVILAFTSVGLLAAVALTDVRVSPMRWSAAGLASLLLLVAVASLYLRRSPAALGSMVADLPAAESAPAHPTRRTFLRGVATTAVGTFVGVVGSPLSRAAALSNFDSSPDSSASVLTSPPPFQRLRHSFKPIPVQSLLSEGRRSRAMARLADLIPEVASSIRTDPRGLAAYELDSSIRMLSSINGVEQFEDHDVSGRILYLDWGSNLRVFYSPDFSPVSEPSAGALIREEWISVTNSGRVSRQSALNVAPCYECAGEAGECGGCAASVGWFCGQCVYAGFPGGLFCAAAVCGGGLLVCHGLCEDNYEDCQAECECTELRRSCVTQKIGCNKGGCDCRYISWEDCYDIETGQYCGCYNHRDVGPCEPGYYGCGCGSCPICDSCV